MHNFCSLKKSIQKENKSHFWGPFNSEMNMAPLLHRQKSKHIFQKALLLNCRCQHLIYHTLSAFQNPVWHYYSKQKISRIFVSQGCFFPLLILIFPNPTTKYYINLYLVVWTASRHRLYSMCISHIAYLRQNIAMSGLQGVRHSEKILLLFLLLAGSDRTERSKFVSSKSVLFHNVDTNAGPFTAAETEGHKWNIIVYVCVTYFLLFFWISVSRWWAS